jgi:hypothetical protein
MSTSFAGEEWAFKPETRCEPSKSIAREIKTSMSSYGQAGGQRYLFL